MHSYLISCVPNGGHSRHGNLHKSLWWSRGGNRILKLRQSAASHGWRGWTSLCSIRSSSRLWMETRICTRAHIHTHTPVSWLHQRCVFWRCTGEMTSSFREQRKQHEGNCICWHRRPHYSHFWQSVGGADFRLAPAPNQTSPVAK